MKRLALLDRYDKDVLASGLHRGIDYAVLHNGIGYRCGYIRLPAGHPWLIGDNHADYEADCHGGVTYSEGNFEEGGWIGWDYAHAWDLPDTSLVIDERHLPAAIFMSEHRHDDSRMTTTEEAVAECKNVIDQSITALGAHADAHGPEPIGQMLARAVLAGDAGAADMLADWWIENKHRRG